MARSPQSNIDALLAALREQVANQQPGRVPSGIAMNDYLASIPPTNEQGRESAILQGLDERLAGREASDRKLQEADMLRRFDQRTGVNETMPPKAFTAENFPPMASHAPTRVIRRVPMEALPARSDVSTQFGPSQETRTIRRFTNNQTPIDADAAMGLREKAMIDPRVLAEQERSRGDVAAASITAGAKGKTGESASRYALETANRTISAIDEVLPKIGYATAGVGSMLRHVPGSDAANVSAELSSVASNVAFNALQAMRDASKTGGALGQVSERELDLLSAVMGSIRQDQSPDNLRKNLGLIRESQQRFVDAAGRLNATSPEDSGSESGSGGMVSMVAPDGRKLSVPADKVAELEAKGAKRQ